MFIFTCPCFAMGATNRFDLNEMLNLLVVCIVNVGTMLGL
jgi:hypothetical protein